jgi:4-amino-4-deoxy-L-arabinose transferase-like glycosyltransferase
MQLSQREHHGTDRLVLLVILVLAAILRFWRLDEYLTFLGDQGRDALEVERMLTTGALPLVGPPTSTGGLHFGPAYFYLIALPMAFFWLSPVAAAGMVAGLAVASVGLLYHLARCWFGQAAAVAGALVYSVSAISIVCARTAWNPNPLPFFALLVAWTLFTAHRESNPRWYTLTAFSLAMALQLHYAAVLLIPASVAGWLMALRHESGRWKNPARREFLWWSAIALALFLGCTFSFLVVTPGSDGLERWTPGIASSRWAHSTLANVPTRAYQVYADGLVGKYLAAEHSGLRAVTAGCLLVPLLARGRTLSGAHARWGLILVTIWLTTGVLGLALTPLMLQDHYLACLAPAVYLLFAAFVGWAWSTRPGLAGRIRQACVLGVTSALVFVNLLHSPLRESPDRDLARAEAVAQFIHAHTGSLPYRLLVVSDRSFEAAYAFHLSLYGDPPLDDSELPAQLFVVCELPECDPLREARAALPAFAAARIDGQIQLDRAGVYRLVS